MPAVPISATASVELARRQDPTAPWEDVVEKLLVSGRSGAYDPLRGALVAADGEWAMPLEHNVLQDMADTGVLVKSTSVFGECEYAVAPSSSSWVATYEVHRGECDALAHLSGKPLHHMGQA